jgi:hypothetical protein
VAGISAEAYHCKDGWKDARKNDIKKKKVGKK